MAPRSPARVHGLLLVDKPSGPTSHDVVAWARRALGTREVGHTGTLDPAATGLLVLVVGEATKLAPYLVADDKRYEATVALGAETDTLDADGAVVATAPVPAGLDEAQIRATLGAMRGRHAQVVPAFSAVKRGGRPLHERARRGEAVEPPTREVELHGAELVAFTRAVMPMPCGSSGSPPVPEDDVPTSEDVTVAVRLHTGSGFFVRSLARDLGRALGTVGHVRRLRRTAVGRFRLPDAPVAPHDEVDLHPWISGETLRAAAAGVETARAEVAAALVPLADVCRSLPCLLLAECGVRAARSGRPLGPDSFADPAAFAALLARRSAPPAVVAALAPGGAPVALLRLTEAPEPHARVVRGFAP
jgi:tRNA pseudouridine55 synthase